MSATVSTHVLDAERGRPAAGLAFSLALADGTIQSGVTDADGRARLEDAVPVGVHTLSFATGPWFAERGRSTFYPRISVAFEAVEGEHHHVALLLSPFAYTTYRGS